jgi:hypothetical protein
MYLTSPSLNSLYDFLVGVSVGRHFRAVVRKGERPFGDFSAWFWIHRDAPESKAWYSSIMHESKDDLEAFERFFDYLAVYRQAVPVLEYHFRLTPRQQRVYCTAQRSWAPHLTCRAPHHLRLTRYKGERGLLLHKRLRGVSGWNICTVFKSIPQSRRWLAKVYGITRRQWEIARKH